ncbi:hypothetical protein ACFQZS_10995 [Mucilaginibacter calamicampi]|uniref:Uncharacterized protein n=1 Tax=Mucilaginibacter calamicampi TaxID=1302352 RepID=A0ABW2YXX2_9SPHI
MPYLKKSLLLFTFCLAVLSTKATARCSVADTTVKITVDAVGQILPTPLIIAIAAKNDKFKIAYTVVDSVFRNAYLQDPAHKEIQPKTSYFISPYIAISLRNSVKRVDTIATADIVLKDAIARVVNLDSRERLTMNDMAPVLDGHHVKVEITTPAGTKRISSHSPMPDHDTQLYQLLQKCIDIYRDKYPKVRLRAVGY